MTDEIPEEERARIGVDENELAALAAAWTAAIDRSPHHADVHGLSWARAQLLIRKLDYLLRAEDPWNPEGDR